MTLFARIKPAAALLVFLVMGLLLLQSPALAQETTGSVSGVVQDTTRAAVPQATVVLSDLQNKAERKTVSDGSGNFTLAGVAAGPRYQLSVTMPGFKTWQSEPFALLPGDHPSFTDIRLAAGETVQVTVEATASQAVKPLDTPERSDVITSKDLETLAIVGRDAEELIETLPGFAMTSPGVNNQSSVNTDTVGINNNISGGYSSNGLGPTALATILDGVSLTDIQTNSGTVQTVDADMIANVKVSTANFSAVSAKGPAIFNATTKTGGTTYHGDAYVYARDSALYSNDWENNNLQISRPDARYLFPGGTIGGPLWIPGTRFTRNNNKLFFFFGLEYFEQKFSPETLDSYVPTMAERQGDFSVANLNAQLCGSRPDGTQNPNTLQTMCFAENFLADGQAVIDGNVAGQANAGGVALVNWLPLPNANPFTNSGGFNYVQPVEQTQNGDLLRARIDYSINDNNKLYISYGRQTQTTQDPAGLGFVPAFSTLYPGNVETGDISNIISLNYTRVFGASVTNEFNAALSLISDPGNLGNPNAVSRFDMNSYNCDDPTARAAGTCTTSGTGATAGNGNYDYIGEYKNTGDFSVPALNDFGGNLGYPNIQMPGGFYNNQIKMKKTVPDVSDSVTWMKGTSQFQFGVYYEKGILNGDAVTNAFPQGELDFNPQNSFYQFNQTVGPASQFAPCVNPQTTGTSRLSGVSSVGACINPIAMMYMGTPDTFTQTDFTPVVDMQYTTLAGYVNDVLKVKKRVTLVLGIRFEHLGPWNDRHGNGLATFAPALYNQQCSRANDSAVSCDLTNDYPGVTWHGINSATSNSVNSPQEVYFTPRVGLAWDIFGHGSTTLRGGWGVYRHEEEFAPYAAAAATAQGYKTSSLQNEWTFNSIDEQTPINPQDFSIDVLTNHDTVRPVYFTYNATISQRLDINRLHIKNSLIEVAYVGSNSQNLSSFNQDNSYNEASDINLIPQGYMFQGSSSTFCLCNLPTSLAANAISSLSTQGQDYFRPFPFYQHVFSLKHNFYSNYNSLQVAWNESTGPVTFGANYTFSKSLSTAGSFNNNLVDPVNLRNDYNPDTADRTSIANVHYQVDIGKRYHGPHTFIAEIVNGWLVSGISQFLSGPDLASEQGENFGFGSGSLQATQVATSQQEPSTMAPQCQSTFNIPTDANGNHYCVTNLSTATWLGTPDYELMPTLHCNPAGGPKAHQFINATCFGVPLPGSPAGGGTGVDFSNSTGQGVNRMPYIRGPGNNNQQNLTAYKSFQVGEKKTLQVHISAFNFLNHPDVSFNNNATSNLSIGNLNFATAGQPITAGELSVPNFGIANIKFGSRRIELGAKFSF